MQIRIHFNLDLRKLKVNRVIRYLIAADLLLWGGWGLVGPIFAVFVLEKVQGASLVVIGAGTTIYWVVKSMMQIPVALYLDRHEGEKDDLLTLIASFIFAGFTAMAFTLVHSVPAFFFVAFLQGVSFGLYVPAWSALFSRHLDKDHYSLDWSLDSTALGIGTGITALLGGVLGTWLGFNAVFIAVSIFSFLSAVLLISVPDLILPRPIPQKDGVVPMKDHFPSV